MRGTRGQVNERKRDHGHLLQMKNPCIVLENVVCEGAYNTNTSRSTRSFWRGIWLEQAVVERGA